MIHMLKAADVSIYSEMCPHPRMTHSLLNQPPIETMNFYRSLFLLLVCTCLATVLIIGVHSADTRGLSTRVSARWAGHPLITQALEIISRDSKEHFWSLIDAVAVEHIGDSAEEQKAWLDQRPEIRVADKNGLFSLSLSLFTGAGKCALFQQVGEELLRSYYANNTLQYNSNNAPPDWFVFENIGGSRRLVTDLNELQTVVSQLSQKQKNPNRQQLQADNNSGQSEETLYEFDHILGSPTAPFIILHADITKKSFSKVYSLVKTAVDQERLRLIFRAWNQNGAQNPTSLNGALQGYGVELAMKNVEYRVLDESQRKPSRVLSNVNDEEEEESERWTEDPHMTIVNQLSIDFPEIEDELTKLNGQLFSAGTSGSSESSIPVSSSSSWLRMSPEEIDLIGVKAMQAILASKDPLRMMEVISQNLPSVGHLLSLQPLEANVFEMLNRFMMHYESMGTSTEGFGNMLIVNGELVNIDDELSVFSLLDRFSGKIKEYEAIKSLGLSHDHVTKIQTTPLQRDVSPKIDLFWPEVACVLNDLETHPLYAKWPRRVRDLLRPAWPGQLLPVAKNFFTVILVVDPSSDEAHRPGQGLLLLNQLSRIILQNNLPIRVVFYVITRNPTENAEDSSSSAAFSEKRQAEACGTQLDEEQCDISFVWAKVLRALYTDHASYLTFLNTAAQNTQSLSHLKMAFEGSGTDISWEEALSSNAVWLKNQYLHLSSAGFIIPSSQGEDDSSMSSSSTPSPSTASNSINNNIVLLNGLLIQINPDEPLGAIAQSLQAIKTKFTSNIYNNLVTDTTDLYRFGLGDADEVYPAYHPLIFNTDHGSFVDLSKILFDFDSLPYSIPPGSQDIPKKTTHFLVADFSQNNGLSMLKEWIEAMESSTEVVPLLSTRLAILPSPAISFDTDAAKVHCIIERFIGKEQTDLASLKSFVENMMTFANGPSSAEVQHFLSQYEQNIKSEQQCMIDAWKSKLQLSSALLQNVASSSSASHGATAADADESDNQLVAIITNGRRIVLNADASASWDATSWEMLTRYEYAARCEAVYQLIHNLLADSEADSPSNQQTSSNKPISLNERANLLMKLVSLLNAQPPDSSPSKRTSPIDIPNELVTYIRSKPLLALEKTSSDNQEANPLLSVSLMIDPLTTQAQKISSILLFFMEKIPMEVKLMLHPRMGISELPLKNYYRYVAHPSLRFDTDSGKLIPHTAVFERLPSDKVLTLNLQTMPQWLVEPTDCQGVDLDNVLLANINPTQRSGDDAQVQNAQNDHTNRRHMVRAKFELEHLIVEGSCQDLSAGGQPPRGLQLELTGGSHRVDTLVMSNLGYFQLKANPGVWSLSLTPGRGTDLYHVDDKHRRSGDANTAGTTTSRSSSSSSTSTLVVLSDFSSPHIPLKVFKRKGMEQEKLYESDDDGLMHYQRSDTKSSFWQNIFGDDKSNPSGDNNNQNDDRVHVFSVASGHLYERFLRIMMLSVKNTTTSPVKFWIIKNFLSPTFKSSIHALANEFGFEVELVQYQWPIWLRGQTEKQRKIWGYKILFLDVLFPLSLKKVIFIDADQVVRSDLKQLMTMDLQGAPYGFTPFCQGDLARPETNGFRFWNSGFWKDHLHNRPYHISALFVVDLHKLRTSGAADALRATYDQLSRDPNSLANLDQDLPNYLQHHVKIFSLPKEWLWCETWCTDESKEAAKTIDLCNNPLTKTPKLDNALRIIPEWKSLDETARDFMDRFMEGSIPPGGVEQKTEQTEKRLQQQTIETLSDATNDAHSVGKDKDEL